MSTALPSEFADEWRQTGTRRERGSIMVLSVVAETTLYEHRETATAMDDVDTTLSPRSLYRIDLEIHPPLSALGVTPEGVFSMAAGKAKGRFISMIESEGLLIDGERKVVSFDRGDGVAGKWYVFESRYPLATETSENAGNSSDSSSDTPGTGGENSLADGITTETHLAIWPAGNSYAMAGGTFPLEAPPGLESTFQVDPNADRETIAAFVRAMAEPTLEPEDDQQ
ncbi:hypothetical protein OB919_03720 [Halobacteria archaeon AArc-curdl1]|uniref:Uncharacterized protein n=1 Tax=Natronosalvus hydrolyticus TaxID=2979988 RepID=A0AAP2Z5L2_9EURY|nr:hypothetical protein [Halobacteria archaeon AArc-curdl1]